MEKKRSKKIRRTSWNLLVVLIWGTFVYETVFTENYQEYGIKEWGIFGGLTLVVGFRLWSLFQRSNMPDKLESKKAGL